jgi:hypothetical protein
MNPVPSPGPSRPGISPGSAGLWIPAGTLIFVETTASLRPPTFDTPLFHFPFLAFVHALSLLVLLPYLAFEPLLKRGTGRIGATLCLSGGLTLVLGFLFIPRSLSSAQAGLMMTLGFLLLFKKYRVFREGLFTPVFYALILTGITGTILGLTLARQAIDPIPFSGIEIHVLLGLAFALTTFLRVLPPLPETPGIGASTLLFGLALVLLFALELPLKSGILAASSLGVLIIALKGVPPSVEGSRPLWILGLAVAAVLSPIWDFGAGPMLSLFVLAWLYLLIQGIFSDMGGRLTGFAGSLSFLAGLFADNRWIMAAGVALHTIAVVKWALSGKSNGGAVRGRAEIQGDMRDGSSSTPSSQTSTS